MDFKLCWRAPRIRSQALPGLRRSSGTGICSSPERYRPVSECGSAQQPLHIARVNDAAAVLAGAGAEVQ